MNITLDSFSQIKNQIYAILILTLELIAVI